MFIVSHGIVVHFEIGPLVKKKKTPGQNGTISLFSVGLKFQPKMKSQVFCLSTGYINYISVLTNSV